MQWVALAWEGDFLSSVRVCVAASDDLRLSPEVRDLFVGIAVLDHFSLTTGAAEPPGLVDRALGIADRTEVALTRVLCRLGVAWALIADEPESLRRSRPLGPRRRRRGSLPSPASRCLGARRGS